MDSATGDRERTPPKRLPEIEKLPESVYTGEICLTKRQPAQGEKMVSNMPERERGVSAWGFQHSPQLFPSVSFRFFFFFFFG
jgi:hypothetical protein